MDRALYLGFSSGRGLWMCKIQRGDKASATKAFLKDTRELMAEIPLLGLPHS